MNVTDVDSDSEEEEFSHLMHVLDSDFKMSSDKKRKRQTMEQLAEQEKLSLFEDILLIFFVKELNESGYTVKNKAKNTFVSRTAIEHKIRNLSDEYFKKLYRLNKHEFYKLLQSIEDQIKSHNTRENAITPLIKLAITLRYLAGAIYLDLGFGYDLNYKTIYTYIHEVLIAIDTTVENVIFCWNIGCQIPTCRQFNK